MKRFITLLLAIVVGLSLVACGAQSKEIAEVTANLTGKGFFGIYTTTARRNEESYYKGGKSHQGGKYSIVQSQEVLLTFNEDGTVDCVDYRAALTKTYFDQEQRKHSDREDGFAEHTETRKYDSFSVIKKDEEYEIHLYKGKIHDWTLRIRVESDGSYTLIGKSLIDVDGHIYLHEAADAKNLPVYDYNTLD